MRAQLISSPGARASVLRRFAQHSSWVEGKKVRIEDNFSPQQGTTAGLDERGFLRLRTANGMETVLSGTVREVSS